MATTLHLEPTPEALRALKPKLATRYKVLPLRFEDGTLVLAMEDAQAFDVLDDLRTILGRPVQAEKASPAAIEEALRTHYGVGADTLDALVLDRNIQVETAMYGGAIDEAATEASIVKFVNEIILDAYNSRATDIHFEPFEDRFRVRYRVDGVLVEAAVPDTIRHFKDAIASRVKIMANLDIAERRLPQDGRIRLRVAQKDLDLRVSVIPIAHGESVNLRLLQRSNVLMGLESLGFDQAALEALEHLLRKPHGIILLTGPTGSGKTTTLYACLNRINETERKIITIEDPVEYQIDGICQMHVRPDIGFTFASGLRSMLRHDPDVMLVGEIRDFETAELAIRCALTGHLVFSTLHTNEAAGAAPRLLDMGVEPFLLASSVEAIIAQRLVRLNCPHCAQPTEPDRAVLAKLSTNKLDVLHDFKAGQGCDECNGTGFRGRTVIYELLAITDEIRGHILKRDPASALRKTALAQGMRLLRDNGAHKAITGLTTPEEILRVSEAAGQTR